MVTPMSEFIKFNVTTRVVSWETYSNIDVGNYIIQIFGTLNSFKSEISFNLEVKASNSSPVLQGLKSFQTIISLNDLKEDTLNFGPLTGPNSGDIVTLSYTVEPSDGNSYFTIDKNSGEFRVTDKAGLLSSSVSRYKIKMAL